MAKLVIAGVNEKGGYNYRVVLESYEDIKVLIKLYKAYEEAGMVSTNIALKSKKKERKKDKK